MKYIIVRDKHTGTRHGLVFSERVTHRDVFAGLRREFEATSAGFVYYDASRTFGIRVERDSESLRLKSDPTDVTVLGDIMGGRVCDLQSYEGITDAIEHSPTTWLPGLLSACVGVCTKRNVFQTGRLIEFVQAAMP